ncbi:MAG TPA: membrane protein insertase YidC [Candidatus Omnitrophota bacterium]|nr:membrane protein insertase YidC [Candidatus Omnitrophota bacterium]HQQ05798.1 membrane protein insertase YidC [Candidatus Omnitrophota bacterium]
MEKRTVLAIALSFLVIFFWSKFVYKPEQPQMRSSGSVISSEPRQERITPVTAPLLASETEQVVTAYTIPGAVIEVSEPDAAIKQAVFDKYKKNKYILNNGLYLADPAVKFDQKISVNDGFSYIYEDTAKRITKTLISTNSHYVMELEIKITNLSSSSLQQDIPIILGRFDLEKKNGADQRFDDIIVSDQSKISHPSFKKPATFQDIKFIGMRDQYFCAIIQPESTGYSGFVNKVSDKVFDIGIASDRISIQPGSEIIQRFKIYLGPQDIDALSKANPSWGAIVYFGMFDIVAQVILGLLKFLFTIVKNWGVAIILLSIAIYLILFPLSIKQMKSMKELQVLQPKMEQLRKQYGDNQKKLNEEMMKLYKEHKVNPLGGCLPMVLQIPIFISLYQVLSRSIALKGAKFLWIKDLSEPDRLFKLPFEIPFIGEYFNILPILMAIGMFIQQKMSSANATGQAAEQQKMMVIIFPIMFGVMFYNVPSGLVMYWFLNSTLMLLYQIKVMRSK